MKRVRDIYILVNAAKPSGRGILMGCIAATQMEASLCPHICEMSGFGRQNLVNDIRSGHVDGLITSELEDPELASVLEASDIPLVVIGTRSSTLPMRKRNLRILTADEESLGALAARYLISLGNFAAYGYVHHREQLCRYLSKMRESGFLGVIRQNGLLGSSYRCDTTEDQPDTQALSAWIKSLPKPVAVLAGDDNRAVEFMEVCKQANLRVPEDVRVIGIGNDEIVCQQTRPKLSSVDTDNACEGRTAVKLLLALLRGRNENADHAFIFAPSAIKVVERESTRILPPGRVLVKAAQEYIAANAGQALSADDVIRHMGISRRLAYLRFKEFAQTSIHQAIIDARIALVKKKLLRSMLSIADISRTCGFPNPNTLKIIFKRETGLTMREWRRRNTPNSNGL